MYRKRRNAERAPALSLSGHSIEERAARAIGCGRMTRRAITDHVVRGARSAHGAPSKSNWGSPSSLMSRCAIPSVITYVPRDRESSLEPENVLGTFLKRTTCSYDRMVVINRNDEVFVLRLWLEKGARAVEWRGSITHVESRECRFFAGYGDLFEFLERWKDRAGE